MTLVERIDDDLRASMKAQDAPRTGVLRMAKAALKNREIDKRSPLDDEEAVKVLQTLVRQREDSVFQFRKANRPELVRKEEAEIEVLKGYLPAEASEAEIGAAVEKAVAETGASSAKDMGRVMKAALAALQAAGTPADGKKVNEAVRRRLGA
ncbi:MAG TPA: GatB/YqeY domain-containing protein [Vicinamibacteria bacterium]|nr:GatB/YqeY domain-containing protein [Vicinamibacteria bacterium]